MNANPPASAKIGPIPLMKPSDIRREARVPYLTVLKWLTVGHPRAGMLPSIDLAETRKRHSYRIRREDWVAFQARLQTPEPVKQTTAAAPRNAKRTNGQTRPKVFRY